MSSCDTTSPIDAQHLHERLSGEQVFNALGNPTEPSQALPFETNIPVPTMLVKRELNYLHWLASTLRGTGRVVELGCFLGGSTAALAAGLAQNAHSKQPILTYDAFETPNDTRPRHISWLRSYRLRPGERFRERFDQLNRSWIDKVIVRDGWLPEAATRHQEHELYPEQEPIELLFVDIAKTWDVHRTVLRTFARHLHLGATIVQQDFFDLQTPWIPLHMWQLRDVLEPLDVLHGTPTLSLSCVGEMSARVDDLWTESDLLERGPRCEAWGRVHDYWSGLLGNESAGFVHGHATMHALLVGDSDEAARCGRLYEAWNRSAESKGVYFAPAWPEIVAAMPEELAARGKHAQDVRVLSAECVVRGSRADHRHPGERIAYCPTKKRRQVWLAAIDRLRHGGHRRIALFGAGQHTQWLLSEFQFDADLEIACIIDDAPREVSVQGVPLVRPDMATDYLSDVTAILPSSDTYELQLLTRAYELYADCDWIEVCRVYTHPLETETKKPDWLYSLDVPCTLGQSKTRVREQHIPKTPAHRALLGLPQERVWASILLDRFALPEWVEGFIGHLEAAFLWDIIEATRPSRIVEIGTASGVSTSMLLAAADHFCDEDTKVYSFDVATECYFDTDRPLASAISEMAPELVNRACLYANANAVNAASCFKVGDVDFAFIDGEHAHPAPTIDLLSLLYAIKPGAWVVLHDIELTRIRPEHGKASWQEETGAERLFDSWPYEKIQLSGDTPVERNIGAIRMPDDPAKVVPHLLSMLRGPWEMTGPAMTHVSHAMRILEGHGA